MSMRGLMPYHRLPHVSAGQPEIALGFQGRARPLAKISRTAVAKPMHLKASGHVSHADQHGVGVIRGRRKTIRGRGNVV